MDWFTLVIVSSVLLGIAAIVEKYSLKQEHATAFSAALTPLVAAISLVFFPLADFHISPFQLALLLVLSVMNAYTFLLSARVFKHGELSTASPAFSTLPTLFTVLIAFTFLSERLSGIQYLSIAGMIIAIYALIFMRPKSGERFPFDDKKYKSMIVLNAAIGGAGTVLSRYLLSGMNPYTFLILSGVFMSAAYAILISIRYGGIKEIAATLSRYKLALGTNAVLAVGYRVTYFIALTIVPVSLAQPVRNTLYTVITVIFGGELFGEKHLAKKLLLSILLLIFAYALTINI